MNRYQIYRIVHSCATKKVEMHKSRNQNRDFVQPNTYPSRQQPLWMLHEWVGYNAWALSKVSAGFQHSQPLLPSCKPIKQKSLYIFSSQKAIEVNMCSSQKKEPSISTCTATKENPKLVRYLYNETQIVFAFAFVLLGIYCLENLVSYNAEGTNTFSIKSHNLRI